MHLRRNSKLLQKANEDLYAVYLYHNTPVLYWDKVTNDVTLKHNGWETRATAAAMNYALEDIGVDVRVRYTANNLYLEGRLLPNQETITYRNLVQEMDVQW
ncbi:MAG: hypothetical protein PHY47_01265 [Lachnospiraceae bacterium]|nr:hypothetical protein [Lachnospiraceae bacterium]